MIQRVLFSALIFIFFSCNYEVNKNELTGNYLLLQGKWKDIRDENHQVIFQDKKWIDLYSGDTASVNPIILYSDYPDQGGKESPMGKFLRLEESRDNFYWLIIEQLDSLRLSLDFISAGLQYEFLKADIL